jgi:osmotically-inducible protein OsmY
MSSSPSSSAAASEAMAKDEGITETDRNLNNQIRTALKADSSLRDSVHKVSLSSDSGVVTLNGTVATEKEKADLESRVKRMAGVKDVENNLQIAPQASSSSSTSSTTATR